MRENVPHNRNEHIEHDDENETSFECVEKVEDPFVSFGKVGVIRQAQHRLKVEHEVVKKDKVGRLVFIGKSGQNQLVSLTALIQNVARRGERKDHEEHDQHEIAHLHNRTNDQVHIVGALT